MNLAAAIADVFAVDPQQPALEFEQRWWTWKDIERQAAGIVRVLKEGRLEPGSRIAVLMRNRPEMVPVLIALISHGYCLATINATAPDGKLAVEVEQVAAPATLAIASDWERAGIVDAAKRVGTIGLALTGNSEASVERVAGLPGDAGKWRTVLAKGIAIEMLSSGTTGAPKRIPLRARNLESALAAAAAFEKGRDEAAPAKLRTGVQIVNGPLAHISGITGVLNNILAGRKICLLERFTVERFSEALIRHRPKVATAPPAALRMLLDADLPADVFCSLVAMRTGTAPLDPKLADAFYERYGTPVLQNYGATEFAGGVAGWTIEDFKAYWKAKYGSVGRLNKGVEGRVIDPETDAVLPTGKRGLLEIKAPNLADGESWVRTTDLAVIDDDKFLWIHGRADGAIIRGGFKILPEDVQQAMESHPAVLEAAVIALEDSRLGQVPVVAWIAKSGAHTANEAEIRDFLRQKLMPYQVPIRILQVDEFSADSFDENKPAGAANAARRNPRKRPSMKTKYIYLKDLSIFNCIAIICLLS